MYVIKQSIWWRGFFFSDRLGRGLAHSHEMVSGHCPEATIEILGVFKSSENSLILENRTITRNRQGEFIPGRRI